MSLEKLLIIKQYQESNMVDCKSGLESSPEQYTVAVANSYNEGRYMIRERASASNEAERLGLVIIDADDVDSYTLELLSNIRGSNNNLPVIVLTKLASNKTRQSLTSMTCECIIKTGEYNKFLWNSVKNCLARNSNRTTHTSIKSNKVFRVFSVGKKKA